MEEHLSAAKEWLDREDSVCRDDRAKRLAWIASAFPACEYQFFPGGWMAKYLFEEARYCFVYGQFLATIVLGCAYMERTLAAMLYGAGRDDLERASASKLFEEALKSGWLSAEESVYLERARNIRNPVVHFRQPGHEDTIERRSVTGNQPSYSIFEDEARQVMATVLKLMTRNTV
ncbi:MAG: hypothetical protein QME92_05835 [Bacillota bacterium]|nr:hypothetical protein [Bacillota bacterium]